MEFQSSVPLYLPLGKYIKLGLDLNGNPATSCIVSLDSFLPRCSAQPGPLAIMQAQVFKEQGGQETIWPRDQKENPCTNVFFKK